MAGVSSGEELRAWDLNERIHPQLKAAFEAAPSLNITPESLGSLRKAFIPETLPKDESVEIRDEVTGSGVRVKVYKPKTEQKEFPALLWIHGGGHIFGVPEMDAELCTRFAKEAKCIVVAPDYRLAPEHPYPADVDDCYGALVWMTENLPVRKDRVAVAGQSAGGISCGCGTEGEGREGPGIVLPDAIVPYA